MPLRAFFVFPQAGRFRTTLPTMAPSRSQCPYGHSLFFHLWKSVSPKAPMNWVSMPLRAFFVFPRTTRYDRGGSEDSVISLNALTGILCFSTALRQCDESGPRWSQCPYGHSLFFHGFPVLCSCHGGSLNALTGILCFSTGYGGGSA